MDSLEEELVARLCTPQALGEEGPELARLAEGRVDHAQLSTSIQSTSKMTAQHVRQERWFAGSE